MTRSSGLQRPMRLREHPKREHITLWRRASSTPPSGTTRQRVGNLIRSFGIWTSTSPLVVETVLGRVPLR